MNTIFLKILKTLAVAVAFVGSYNILSPFILKIFHAYHYYPMASGIGVILPLYTPLFFTLLTYYKTRNVRESLMNGLFSFLIAFALLMLLSVLITIAYIHMKGR